MAIRWVMNAILQHERTGIEQQFVLQDGDPLGYERLPLLALTFLGAIFFTGGLISVVSNILTGRIARFRQGEIRYRFDGHIVLREPTTRPQD